MKSILDLSVNRPFAARRTWLAAAFVIAAVVAPLTALSLHAQQPAGAGSIAGVVIDQSGWSRT